LAYLSNRLRLALATAAFNINPFSALPRSQRLFSNWPQGVMLKRRLFGYDYFCDVSRTGPQGLLYLLGERHVREARILQSLLCQGMRVVDVGANVGYYTLMIAQKIGPTGSIVAVEPSPENLPELRKNIACNRLPARIIEVAVGANEGIIQFDAGINGGVCEQGPYTVRQFPLDDLLQEPIDFIKIDIEGCEMDALLGARRLLSSRPVIFLEVHPMQLARRGYSAAAVVGLLRDTHYTKLSMYTEFSPVDVYRKVLREYGLIDSINLVLDDDEFLDHCDSGQQANPFWVVARA
jgi:FkbM family methyltransferase